jgi:hypothetical protein
MIKKLLVINDLDFFKSVTGLSEKKILTQEAVEIGSTIKGRKERTKKK